MAEKKTEVASRERQSLTRREPIMTIGSPFRTLEQFADEMDRVFDNFGLGRSWTTPRSGHGWLSMPLRAGADVWAPDIEVYQRNNELVVRADLPGMKKDDVHIDVTDSDITISGDRKSTRLNSSHQIISYAVFCLKKKKKKIKKQTQKK